MVWEERHCFLFLFLGAGLHPVFILDCGSSVQTGMETSKLNVMRVAVFTSSKESFKNTYKDIIHQDLSPHVNSINSFLQLNR